MPPDFIRRRTADWIVADLAALDAAAPAEPDRCGPSAPDADFGFIDSFPAAVGGLYVLEGSTLGAQLLSRMLRETLGHTAESGGRWLAAYGDETGPRWKRFQTWLNEVLTTPAEASAAERAAIRTFERFSERLSRCDRAQDGTSPAASRTAPQIGESHE